MAFPFVWRPAGPLFRWQVFIAIPKCDHLTIVLFFNDLVLKGEVPYSGEYE